jgi:signal transduction histidine kinase
MKLFMDRNRIYLVCFYFSMSFFYLSFALGEEDPVPMLGYILALIIFIVLSHDSLLQVISQSTGQAGTTSELSFFSAFVELNRKIHNFLEVDDVLVLVNDTLKEKVQVRKVIYLLSHELFPSSLDASTDSQNNLLLRGWPDEGAWGFHNAEFEQLLEKNHQLVSLNDAAAPVARAFAETGTSLLIPVVQHEKVLCVILIGRSDNAKHYTQFEQQMFTFLANQLSIILDRIRIYQKIVQKTALDHAEKVQVMQSLSANIAHEMRTPLSTIRASISGCEEYLPQLLEGYEYSAEMLPEKFSPIREDHRNSILGTPRRIQLMIDQANTVIDMLLMNLRENALDPKLLQVIDARKMVEQAVDRYPFKTGESEKLFLHLKDNFAFLGVESLCIYILFNLLKNACYSLQSATKGEIHITLERGSSANLILFRDTGLGIDPGIVGKVFEGFFTTKHDGTGAGLAFCKRTVNSFGGDITCNSVLGEYAEFRISLPLLARA